MSTRNHDMSNKIKIACIIVSAMLTACSCQTNKTTAPDTSDTTSVPETISTKETTNVPVISKQTAQTEIGYYDPYFDPDYSETETNIETDVETTEIPSSETEDTTAQISRPVVTTPVTSTFVTKDTPYEDTIPYGVYALFINNVLRYYYVFDSDSGGRYYDIETKKEDHFEYLNDGNMSITPYEGDQIFLYDITMSSDAIVGETKRKPFRTYVFRYRPDADIYTFSMDNLSPSCEFDLL